MAEEGMVVELLMPAWTIKYKPFEQEDGSDNTGVVKLPTAGDDVNWLVYRYWPGEQVGYGKHPMSTWT